MRDLIRRFVREESGQDLIEYVFLAMYVTLCVTVGVHALAANIDTQMGNLGTQVQTINRMGSGSTPAILKDCKSLRDDAECAQSSSEAK
jgi:Flp pilus assembly pilin Flp